MTIQSTKNTFQVTKARYILGIAQSQQNTSLSAPKIPTQSTSSIQNLRLKV